MLLLLSPVGLGSQGRGCPITCPIRLNVQSPILCVVHWIQGAGGGFLVLNPGRRNAICRRR